MLYAGTIFLILATLMFIKGLRHKPNNNDYSGDIGLAHAFVFILSFAVCIYLGTFFICAYYFGILKSLLITHFGLPVLITIVSKIFPNDEEKEE